MGLHWNCGSHRASHPHVFCGYLLPCGGVQYHAQNQSKGAGTYIQIQPGLFQERSPGQIKTTLFDDVDRVEQFLAHSTLELAQAIVVPLMMFIFMLRLHWVMALVMLIPMILGIAVPMMMVKNYPDMSAELAEDTEKLNASANEFITAMPVIKMYHLTAEKFEQYRNALHLYTTCWKKMCVSSCNPLSIALVVLDSAILFTLPFGGWLYSKGSLSVASYLLFILLTMCFSLRS